MKFIIQPWLIPLIDFLWKDKSRLKDSQQIFEVEDLPKEIYKQLEDAQRAIIQDYVWNILKNSRTKTVFARRMVEALSNGVVSIK